MAIGARRIDLFPRRSRLEAFLLAVSACFILFSVLAARAEEQSKSNLEPSLVVKLDGGLPASNLVKILNAFTDERLAVRTTPVGVKPDETDACNVLTRVKFPPPCGDFLPYVGKLNPGLNLHTLAGATSLLLPDAKIDVQRTQRYFTRTVDIEKYLNDLIKNWSPIEARIFERRPTEVGIEYNRYAVQLFPDSVGEATRAARIVVDLKLQNSTVEVKGAPKDGIKFFGLPDEDARADCESNNFFERIKISTRSYINWFDDDKSAAKLLESLRQKDTPKFAKQARVHIMDTPVTLTMPNLNPKFSFTSADLLKCTWAYDIKKHHGNHLASIIASQDNGTGFSGIDPNVRLESYDIRNQDSGAIAEEIERTKAPFIIYLFANGFPVKHLVDDGPNWDTAQLRDKNTRFSDSLARTIQNSRALLIVAAGRKDNAGQPPELSATSNLFPQNLGDLPNVIVVSACKVCSRGSADLLDTEFQSEKFVHVAAPGGSPIPAWTSESSMGTAYGSSQAAAYVAGVAANMLSLYDFYREPGQLKYRLQMCSYPLPAATPSNLPNPQRQWLSTGVIDPMVCLLDPSKTWVKTGDTWNSYDIRGWTDETLFTRGQKRIGVANDDVLRIVRTNQNVISYTNLALYMNREGGDDSVYEPDGGLGQVGIVPAGSHSPKSGIVLCDGSKILLSAMDDIIVATDRSVCSNN